MPKWAKNLAERIGLDSPLCRCRGGDTPLHSQRFGCAVLAKSAPYRTYAVLVSSLYSTIFYTVLGIKNGGAYRTRTYGPLKHGHGLAIRCITTLPTLR